MRPHTQEEFRWALGKIGGSAASVEGITSVLSIVRKIQFDIVVILCKKQTKQQEGAQRQQDVRFLWDAAKFKLNF